MTSSNINKIVRSNITLKPWILSKNTSEIVNTCIQKIYKQSQNNFKNDPTKIASSKPENKGPIRALKSQERVRVPLSINVTRAKKGAAATANTTAGNSGIGTGGGSGVPTVAAAAAAGGVGATGERLASNAAANNRRSPVANLTAHRRLLKSSPNYKIYSSRRFGSSASSSNASIFKRSDERRRSTTQTAQLNYLLRTFATQMSSRKPLNPILPKFMITARNQHIESRTVNDMPKHIAQMASAIQHDLMPINNALKDRIALGRPRLNKMAAAQKAKNLDPMNGWHHPPSQELFLSHANQRGIASSELQEQYRRMKNANRLRQFEHIVQMENRNTLLGGVGKKLTHSRVVDEFEVNANAGTPRETLRPSARNQTPNFEQTYKSLLARQQPTELDPMIPPQLPAVNISHITSIAAPTTHQPAKVAPESNVTSYGTQSTTMQTKKPTEEPCVTNEIVAQPTTTTAATSSGSGSGSTTTKTLTLSAPKQSEADASESAAAPFITISKKSATSQVVSRAATFAAQSQMRFNHSAHLKKF